MSKAKKNFLASLLLFILPLNSYAISCSSIFSNGIQTTSSTGTVTLTYHAKITGGNATLATKNLSDSSSWAACSGSNCVASGTPAGAVTETFTTSSGANGAISVAANGTSSIAQGDYTTVTVGQQATLTMSTATGNYKTGAFTTNYLSVVQLQSGDYLINGDLTLGQQTILKRVASSGTTRIFVNGNISLGFQVATQNFSSNQLLIYATGNITSANQVNLSAFIYAGGNASFNYQSVINGAVAAANFTTTGNEVAVNYQSSNLSSANFGDFCAAPSTPVVCTAGLINGLTGSYFNNKTLTAPVTGTRVDYTVDFDWSTGTPGVSGVGADTFSVRWDGYLRAPTTGTYTFQTYSDDGVRLWINNQLVIDNWTDHSVTTDVSSSVSLTAGQSYSVRMEFYENGGYAVAKLYWSIPGYGTYTAIPTTQGVNADTSSSCTVPVQTCSSGLMGGAVGKYYNNINLTGTPVNRMDSAIDFNWASGAPGVTGIGTDNFSVQWDASLKAPTTGNYQFESVSDDGVRVWVNNQLIIDNWTYHSQTSDVSATIALTAGTTYPVKVQYFEGGGSSIIALHWKLPGSSSFTTINGCPATLSYYGISHSGSGITCAAEPITISAYNSSGGLVAPSAGTQITLSTTPATGTWSGGSTYTFTGTETSFIKYLQQITASTLNISVTDGTNTESASLDPSITFTDTAVKFYENSVAGINAQVAGVVDNNAKLKILRTDTNTGACVARATGNQSVKMAAVCRNPTTCVAGQTFAVNGSNIQTNANANLASPTYTTLTLNFDNTGTASIPINYSDVGQLQLVAQMTLAASGNDPAITYNSNSNDFVVKPYSLQISSVQTTSGGANPGGTSTAGAAQGFVSAGTPFQVKVQSINANNAVTPNFGNETVSEKNKLNVKENTLVYPAGGTLTAITGAGDNSFSATAPTGTFVNNLVVWNQVGSLTLKPSLSDADYLGAGDVSVAPAASATVGRFYPDHFRLVSSATSNSCGSFSYMSQPAINLSYQLQAETLSGAVATNYGGNYATAATIATPSYVAENLDGANGSTLSGRVTVPAAVWSSGVINFSTTTASFLRNLTNAVPDGPYISLQLGMNLVDAFDSRALQSLDMKSTTSGACGAACTEKSLGSALNLVYGRLKLDDSFGPETVNLPVNFVTEYWTGNYFALNSSDSCTLIPRAAVTYPSGSLTTDANRTVSVGGGTSQGMYTNITATGIQFGAGTAGNYFTAPGAGKTGTFILKIDLTNLGWLRYDWNQDGNYSDTQLPNANIGFGSYRGNDRIIYWREKLQ